MPKLTCNKIHPDVGLTVDLLTASIFDTDYKIQILYPCCKVALQKRYNELKALSKGPSSTSDLKETKSQSTTSLQSRLNVLKRDIAQHKSNYKSEHGRPPTASDIKALPLIGKNTIGSPHLHVSFFFFSIGSSKRK